MNDWAGHTETGTCHVCGREVTADGIIDMGIAGPTCNVANDGRPGHTREELRESFDRMFPGLRQERSRR